MCMQTWKIKCIRKEIEDLKVKNNDLNNIVLNFTNGQRNFNRLQGSQKCVFDKSGIGYKPSLKQKHYMTYFVKASLRNEHQVTCHYCQELGHRIYACPLRKGSHVNTKMIWVPKGTITNSQWPKKNLVPKNST